MTASAHRQLISEATGQKQQQKKKRNVILNEVKNLMKERKKEGHLGWALWPSGQSLLRPKMLRPRGAGAPLRSA